MTNAPIMHARIHLDVSEMMFVQYMPVKMPLTDVRLPSNLQCFARLFDFVHRAQEDFVYLTAKRMYVSPDRPFNRPGWHADGFGTNDVNYIWCDSAPTEFCVQQFDLSDDCDESMAQMEAQARPENVRTYGAHWLLELNSRVVHRPAPNPPAGLRTFAKISVSRDRYDLAGNAHNYLFDYDWPMKERRVARNHPSTEQ